MLAVDRALVRRKLTVIATNLRDLAKVAHLTLGEYRSDRFRQKGIERLLQKIVDAAVDANQHLLREIGQPPAPDYHTSFIAVGRQRIIPEPLAELLAPSAGLRNRLVHEYDAIDDAVVVAAMTAALRDFTLYVGAVDDYLRAADRA
jgi:uncharacterized protein YutE (UPF0331/DUF86 family)